MTTTPSRPRHAATRAHATRATSTPGPRPWRATGRWVASFLGFPIGGYVAFLVVGPLESTSSALAGGAVAGLVLGLAQAWALGSSGPRAGAWVLSTAVAMAAGTALGAAGTDYSADTTSLVALGAVTGIAVGAAQGALLVRHVGAAALVWPILLGGAWALGWLVSEAVIGSSVDQHFYIFGSSGALVVAVLTAPLALGLERRATSTITAGTAASRTS
jgi:hypothetical protein